MLAPSPRARISKRHIRPALVDGPHLALANQTPEATGNWSQLAVSTPRHGGAGLMPLDVLLAIGLLIVVAKLTEGVLGRFGLNSIIAYTLTGIVLGPVTGVVDPTHDLLLFLEIGVFVLFFMWGWTRWTFPVSWPPYGDGTSRPR